MEEAMISSNIAKVRDACIIIFTIVTMCIITMIFVNINYMCRYMIKIADKPTETHVVKEVEVKQVEVPVVVKEKELQIVEIEVPMFNEEQLNLAIRKAILEDRREQKQHEAEIDFMMIDALRHHNLDPIVDTVLLSDTTVKVEPKKKKWPFFNLLK
jgi:hypothetical protein